MIKISIMFILIFMTSSYSHSLGIYKIFRKIYSRRIKIGTAPRAFTGIDHEYIFFTEKSPVPNNFHPGSINRKLYRIKINSKTSKMLAPMGNVFSSPVIDNKNKRVFYNQKIIDTDNDGIISYNDKSILCSVSFNGKNLTVWTKKNRNFELKSISKKCDKLLITEGKSIYEMDIKNTGKITLLSKCNFYPITVFYDQKDKIICIDQNTMTYEIKNEIAVKLKKSYSIFNNKKIRILNLLNKNMQFISKTSSVIIPSYNIEYLFSVNENNHVFINKSFGRKKIFIGNIKTGEFQNLFKFPVNTTRISISSDKLSLTFLATYDSDNNGILEPGQIDKSSIFFIKLGLFQKE